MKVYLCYTVEHGSHIDLYTLTKIVSSLKSANEWIRGFSIYERFFKEWEVQ